MDLSQTWVVPALVAAGGLFVLVLHVVALGVIPGNRKPSTGMAWLLLVVLAPGVGFVVFLFFGSARVERHRLDRQRAVNALITERTRHLPERARPTGPAYLAPLVHLNSTLGALPPVDDNDVEVIEGYAEQVGAMVAEVERAERYVHLEFYITAWDDVTSPLFEALVAATGRGVDVRLLFDHLGSRRIPGYRAMVKRLRGTDIDWRPMLPLMLLRGKFRRPDLRNHRKLLVVDGHVGFTGSQNLIEPGYHKPANHRAGREWVELMVRVHGPVVAELDAVFATDWNAETDEVLDVAVDDRPAEAVDAVRDVTCQVVPSGPGFVTENNLRMFTTLIYAATRRISLTSPYFVPDESLLYAVTTAAQRGVEIELFVSEQSDQFMVGHAQASYYRALLDAGVVIHLYPRPAVLHSKHFTIDDDVAVIGSSNMDQRSFSLNFEISLMMLGTPVVERLRQVEDHYRAVSRTLTVEEWDARRPHLRYLDNVMRLTSALQ